MRPEFEWDEANEEKLLRLHNVSALEAEQCFGNRHDKRRCGKDLRMLGVTDSGQMLFMIYQQKPDGAVRVYSARDMEKKERRAYHRSLR